MAYSPVPATFFNTTLTVYGRDLASGQLTQLLRSNLRGRVDHLSPGNDGGFRDELLRRRRIFWDHAYVMPGYDVAIQSESTQWIPVEGTFAAIDADDGTPMFRRCEVIEAAGLAPGVE